MEIEKKREYKSKVSTILEEVKNGNINLGNYRKYQDKLQSTEEIVLAMIENTMTEYQDMSAKYDDLINKTSFKDSLEGGIVSKEVFDLLLSIIKNSKERFSWQSLQLELNSVMRQKLFEIMGDTQAYEIKKDSLQEMREDSKRIIQMALDMQKQTNELAQSSMNGRILHLEDKMTNFMERAMGKINDERKQMYDIMKTIIKAFQEANPLEQVPMVVEPVKITKEEVLEEIAPDIEESRKKAQEMEVQRIENARLRKELEEQKEKMRRQMESKQEPQAYPPSRPVAVKIDDLDMDEGEDDLDMDAELQGLEKGNEDW